MAFLIPDKTVASTAAVELDIYSPLPPHARLDRTWNNGTESTLHRKADDELGMATYYADPYSSWQRGSNENHNRQI